MEVIDLYKEIKAEMTNYGSYKDSLNDYRTGWQQAIEQVLKIIDKKI